MGVGFEVVSFDVACARVEGLAGVFEGHYETVLLVDGDLSIEGDFLEGVAKYGTADLVVVTGDLAVSGRIALYETIPGLYVGGGTTAETLEGGDCEIHIGVGDFTHLVYGYYNSGILSTGPVIVPWVINSDHDLRVSADGASYVDNYGDVMLDEADYTPDTIVEAFVLEVVDEEDECLDVTAFLERLRAGLPVLKS
ncbi:hypothetical protein [Stackebrandtia soli]|uniref:hypothetical protein n=1 Tax=Stackebrandtia soli TaxID=1892856 RepID=UPI0039EB4BB9